MNRSYVGLITRRGLEALLLETDLAAPLLIRRAPPVVLLISVALIVRLLYFAWFEHAEHRYMVSVFPLAYVAAGCALDRLRLAFRERRGGGTP